MLKIGKAASDAIITKQSQTRGRMKSQQYLIGRRGVLSANMLWHCLFFLLASLLCCMDLICLTQPVVHAASNRNPSSTVRPILPAAKDSTSGARSPAPRRLPFLPSRNSRKAAKEAYLVHLENELESAQRQLYVSQNTCTTLRKRWEDQRRETLELMTARINSDIEAAGIGEEEQQQIEDQKDEIKRLQGQLQTETDKQEQQVERLNLLAAELKELQVWKEAEEQSNEGKVSGYEQQLHESHQKQSDYAEQVELLALKLEAAEFAAKQNQRGEEADEGSTWERRAQALRLELENVRTKYSKMLLSSLQASAAQTGEGGTDQQQQIEEEMDGAIQSAFESALETIEKDWTMRYETIEDQLRNMTEYSSSLEKERDSALSQAQEAVSSSSVQSDQKPESSDLLKKQTRQLREELTAELTDSLNIELTEKLTKQLTETLAENMEKKYKKKVKRLRKELKEQQQTASEDKQSQEDMAQHQQQIIKDEIKKVKEQHELEYASKLQQLQKQSEEQVQVQKVRMRKLVQALMEREAKQKGEKVQEKQGGVAKQAKTRSSSRKKKRRREDDSGSDGGRDEKCDGDEFVPVAVTTSRRTRPGVVPLRDVSDVL